MLDAKQEAPEQASGIRLNIGCGKKIWAGFINVDFPDNFSGEKPDVECDVRKLPFADDYADEAYAIHVFEHFYRWEAKDVLDEWMRVVKPGGRLILELPCLDKVISFFYKKPVSVTTTMWALYGDPRYQNPHMVHKWAWCIGEILWLAEQAGYKAHEEPAQYHVPERDMRIVVVK